MKKLFQPALIIILILTGEGWLFSKGKSRVTFFAPGSFYVYVMGSYNHFVPPEDYYYSLEYESADAFAPVVGLGYRVLDIRDRFFISLEGDYRTAKYDFGNFARGQKIDLLTLMANMEASFTSRFPMIVFLGMGVGIHRLPDLRYENSQGELIPQDDSITVMALDLGVKIPISRSLFIRTEFRWNGEVYGSYDYHYDDEWDSEYDNTEWDFLSSSFSVGLEFHF